MPVPSDRKYARTHEWSKAEGRVVTVGITQYAADELTDVTYVELPAVGSRVEAGAAFGEIESVKATSDLYSPVGGTIVAVNDRLQGEPELVNQDPFGEGWMIQVEATDVSPLDSLMDAAAYEQTIRG